VGLFGERGVFVFDFFNFHHHFQSLPSGHSQTLFTTATFFSFLFPKASPYLFIFAFYFSMTRALTIAHFVSDVIFGAGLGIIVTVITTRHLVQKYGS
jgi:membrane-associated phospholipid phosphatase